MSHSIHMLSIQIDTKSLEFGYLTTVQQYLIVLICKDYVPLLDTLEYGLFQFIEC